MKATTNFIKKKTLTLNSYHLIISYISVNCISHFISIHCYWLVCMILWLSCGVLHNHPIIVAKTNESVETIFSGLRVNKNQQPLKKSILKVNKVIALNTINPVNTCHNVKHYLQ